MERCLIVSILLLYSVSGGVTGLKCYSCDDVYQPSLCNVSQECSQPGQVCIQAENVNDDFRFSYKLGCGGVQYCHGTKKRNLRHFCCSTDLCNTYDISSSTIQSTTTVSPTTLRTTHTKTTVSPTARRTTQTTLTSQQTTTRATAAPPQFEHDCRGHEYYLWNHKCYYLTTHKTSWDKTRHGHHGDPCKEHHMHMAVFSSDAEHVALVKFLRNIYKYHDAVWLGGSYIQGQHEWQWITDSHGHIHRDDSHWHSHSEPNYHQCMALIDDKWRSRPCSTEYKHLCETWSH
ncbi:uncharacterized protein LOC143049538 [Mytilus galloprovincialis]|uniref:uncharacterized protein LOC143049538 n=1 Tax=Mytilus galloprovincialis TaxID=29158 RepID=UPI003F7CC232